MKHITISNYNAPPEIKDRRPFNLFPQQPAFSIINNDNKMNLLTTYQAFTICRAPY